MRVFIVLSLVFLCAQLSFSEQRFPGVKALMTEEEFKKAGLDKQTDDEIKALNQWLVRYTAVDAEVMKRSEEVKKESTKKIRSRIKGEFLGWRGDTVFQLENGQVWKQRLDGRWKITLDSPEVEISRNMLGFYKMKVVEEGVSIGVKRVK